MRFQCGLAGRPQHVPRSATVSLHYQMHTAASGFGASVNEDVSNINPVQHTGRAFCWFIQLRICHPVYFPEFWKSGHK